MAHDIAIWLRLFWGLAHKRPKTTTWQAKNGIVVTGAGDDSIPYGHARTVLLYLVSQAAEQGRVIRGTLDTLETWSGLDNRRTCLGEHLRRLVACNVATHDAARCGTTPILRSIEPFETRAYCARTGAFEFTLTHEFLRSIQTGPRYSARTVKALIQANQLAALDHYLWYRYRLHHALIDPVAILGPHSPGHLIQLVKYRPNWPGKIAQYHAIVHPHWHDCPFSISDDGKHIEYTPRPGQHIIISREPLGSEAPNPGPPSPDPIVPASSPHPNGSTSKRHRRTRKKTRRERARQLAAANLTATAKAPPPQPPATALPAPTPLSPPAQAAPATEPAEPIPLPSPDAIRKILAFLADPERFIANKAS